MARFSQVFKAVLFLIAAHALDNAAFKETDVVACNELGGLNRHFGVMLPAYLDLRWVVMGHNRKDCAGADAIALYARPDVSSVVLES